MNTLAKNIITKFVSTRYMTSLACYLFYWYKDHPSNIMLSFIIMINDSDENILKNTKKLDTLGHNSVIS